jgi:hypothetical protein
MSAEQHSNEEIQLSQERRDRVITALLDYFTGPDVDSKTLGHFKFIGAMFGLDKKVRESCRASSVQGRQELAVTVAPASLNLAVSDEPLLLPQHVLDKQEAKEAEKEWKEHLTTARSETGKGSNEPLEQEPAVSPSTGRPYSQNRQAVYKRKRIARMTPDELAAYRAASVKKQMRYKARLKAKRDAT